MSIEKYTKEHDSFLLELYKTRVTNYNAQGQRLWTRFNYFLLMESATLALHFHDSKPIAVYFGILLSIAWYFIAAQDHYFFREHRARVAELEREHIIPRLQLINAPPSIGDRVLNVKTSWVSFSTKRFTVTHFAVYAPVFLFILWLMLFVDKYYHFLPIQQKIVLIETVNKKFDDPNINIIKY